MMKLATIAARNLRRSWFRTVFTILGAAVALIAFVMIRTLLWAWTVNAESGAQDRLATRHRVSLMVQLPKRYITDIRTVAGIQEATYANWFGARYPAKPDVFFANLAVDPESYLKVNNDLKVSEEDRTRWLADKSGALVGAGLAKTMGWKVGDSVSLEGSFYPGNWEFHVSGIYSVIGTANDDASFLFHWSYLNDIAPPELKDQIGWINSRITDDKRSAEISKAVDALFESRDNQTATMSERTMMAGFLQGAATIVQALNVVSIVILVIMLLILGNTIAMGARERTREYAVLRAIGFEPRHVRFFVIAEAATLGILAGVLGIALAYPFVNDMLAPVVADNLGNQFPHLRVQPSTAVIACAGAAVLAIVASLLPAVQAGRISVTDALRRVG